MSHSSCAFVLECGGLNGEVVTALDEASLKADLEALHTGQQIHHVRPPLSRPEQRIDLLLKNGIAGLALVLAILYIFLNGRVAFWVAVGIPTSFLGALAVLEAVTDFPRDLPPFSQSTTY